jgi:lactate permease
MYQQVLDPVGNSLGLSTLVAAAPLLTLFVLLGIVRAKAYVAGLASLAVALLVAIVAYGMPVGQGLLSASEGAVFGFFPILWIVINAIWIYNMTVATGHFAVLRRAFGRISDDKRIQAVIVAFSFGALIEGLAGFGTPVAITSVMLVALGFNPIKAAILALIGNTAPVAFGSIATPIITLAETTQLPKDDLGAMVGRQTPLLALIVPLVLIYIVDGRRGLRQAWLPALLTGAVFAVGQFVASNYVSVELTDIIGSLLSVAFIVVFLRFWTPGEPLLADPDGDGRPAAGGPRRPAIAGAATHDARHEAEVARRDREEGDSRREVFDAFAPYLIIIGVFAVAQIPAINDALDSVSQEFAWPGLDVRGTDGEPVSSATFNFNWLVAPGTLALICGVLTALALQLSPARALKAYADTLRQLLPAIVTVMAVLALAYVMNQSGQTLTIGSWAAGAGDLFAFFASIIGWLGVAVTGSDTSSNALFGALQVTAAKESGLDAVLMASANTSGGVLGKMISPQNLAIGAAAVGLAGQEGDILRRVLVWSLVMLLFMCLLVYAQSTSLLGWMVP